MSPKTAIALRLDPDIVEALRQIRERDGVPVTEQVTRALRAWIGQKGLGQKTGRKRAATRTRP